MSEEFMNPLSIAAGSQDEVIRDLHTLRFETKKVREELGMPGNQKEADQWVDRVVFYNLMKRGKAFCSGGLGYLLLEDRAGVPIAVSDKGFEFAKLLEKDFNVLPGDSCKDRIGKYVGMQCSSEGIQTQVRLCCHYEKDTQTAYFSEQKGKLIRITKDLIERVENGADGQLFIFPDDYEPFTVDLENMPIVESCFGTSWSDACVNELIFGGMIFEDGLLTQQEKLKLLMAYMLTLFLPGLVKDRLILLLLGPSGCGKTFLLRVIGIMLQGSHFDVTNCPRDTAQLENKLVNNPFIAFDDSDYLSTDALAILRQASTGGTVQRRELYNTFKQVQMPFRATFSFSTVRSPFNGSEEMANRQLALHLRNRKTKIAEETLIDALLKARPLLMAEMFERIRRILTALHEQRDYSPQIENRLASFATFLLRIAKQEDEEEETHIMLESWVSEQRGVVFEDNDLADAMLSFFRSEKFTAGQQYNAGELKELLSMFASGKPKCLETGKRVAGLLHRNEEAFSVQLGMKIGKDKHRCTATYSFNPRAELLKVTSHTDLFTDSASES